MRLLPTFALLLLAACAAPRSGPRPAPDHVVVLTFDDAVASHYTNVAPLLKKYGFEYSSNLMDDIRPYRHEDGLVELPVSWMLDDAPHFWFSAADWNKTIRTNDEVYRLWRDELDGIAGLQAHYMLTMHPQFIGRPSRLKLLDRLIGDMVDTGAWIAPARDVARWVP